MCFLFFFKQKTAYEMLRSLVGSEMCIRDRPQRGARLRRPVESRHVVATVLEVSVRVGRRSEACLLYTSDAADDLLCVDLGGRRIIKKKNKKKLTPDIKSLSSCRNYIEHKYTSIIV